MINFLNNCLNVRSEMRVGKRLAKVDEQLEAVEFINTVKSIYGLSYRELSQILDIPESLLCRYANGDLLP